MAPIEQREVNLGASFVEADCYSCVKRGLPKLLFKKHCGYGTRVPPTKEDVEKCYKSAQAHDASHIIVVFIGHG
jgi:hypothetical protein